jgi:hypothetical protein
MVSDRYIRQVAGSFNVGLSLTVFAVSMMWIATAADRLFRLGWGWDRQILWIAPIIVGGALVVRLVGHSIFRAVGATH